MPLAFLDRVSCFETLRAYGGEIFGLEGHCRRLAESCAALGATLPGGEGALSRWIRETLEASRSPDALLRVSVHWGPGGAAEWVALVRPFLRHPDRWYRDGVEIETAVNRRWTLKAQDPQIKASQFMPGVLAEIDRGERKPHELLFLGPGGTVAEGTVSNIFLVKAKTLLTPPVSSGILRGVTRAGVIREARRLRIGVVETPLTRHDVYSADECFLTNTSSEVLPVTRADGRSIGSGRPGPLTAKLAAAFSRAIRKAK